MFSDLKAADVMRPFGTPLAVPQSPAGDALPSDALPGDATPSGPDGDAVLASESLAGTLRQLAGHGREGLPVVSADGRQLEGWITDGTVLRAVADRMHSVGGDG